MQRKVITTRVLWTMSVWLLVSAYAVALTSAARADRARFATAQSRPFYGVLRFLAPKRVPRHHKMTRAARRRHLRVARVPIERFYPRSPYSPGFVADYPGPPFAYAGAPPFAGYGFGYSPGPYGYRYEFQYPYYVYYVAPWYYGTPWLGGY